MPWSIPVASIVGFATGFVSSEALGQLAADAKASEDTVRIVRRVTHFVVSTAVQTTISTMMADPVGLAAAPVSALAGSQLQLTFEQFINGHAPPLPPAL